MAPSPLLSRSPVAILGLVTLLATATPATTRAVAVPANLRQSLLQTGRVGPAVLDSFADGGRARVVVAFTVDSPTDERGLRSPAARRAIAHARESVLAGLDPADVAVTRRFETVNAFAASVTPAGVEALAARDGVVHVEIDPPGSGALGESLPLVHIDDVHGLGATGIGTTVAVLDSGIDSDHPDLAGALVDEACFCQRTSLADATPGCPGGIPSQVGPGAAEDDHGHGTHVTAVLAGGGAAAPVGGAPGAGVVSVKVLSSANFGLVSDWIAGLDWVAANHPEVAAVNMSLGVPASFAGDCDGLNATFLAMAVAVDNLRAGGASVFVASHNQGFANGVAFPACLSGVVAVGATYDADLGSASFTLPSGSCTDATTAAGKITCFSNSGSNLDLVAPGADVLASWVGGGTAILRGTSMATPLAAACAALLSEQDPAAPAAEIEAALRASPIGVVDAKNGLTFPLLDCEASAALLGGCGTAPRSGCREAQISLLSWKDRPGETKDAMLWRWKKGAETSPSELDDPTDASRYQICLYPGGGSPIAWAPLPAGTEAWKALPLRGYRYSDRTGSASGLTRMRLLGGAEGTAKVLVKGKGGELPPLPLPAALPLTIQLVNRETNVCFTSTFDAEDVTRNDATALRARAD